MQIQEYLDKMKVIQNNFCTFVDCDQNANENFQNLIKIFDDYKIQDNQHMLKSLLNFISISSLNHHRTSDYFTKIEQVLQHFKDYYSKYFSNFEIFNIFKENKRIILSLIQLQILTIDKTIANTIINNKYFKANYSFYFFPELKPFLDEMSIEENEESDSFKAQFKEFSEKLPENFEEKRKIGENDHSICEIIRKDSLQEFIDFFQQKSLTFDVSIKVERSVFETNPFLIKKLNASLVEYAAFFGSIRILKHMLSEVSEIAKQLWIAAIHGNNLDLIHYLEEKQMQSQPGKIFYIKCLKTSIKCHHNEIANYIKSAYLKDENEAVIEVQQSIKCYNFAYLQNESINKSVFYDLCASDYFLIVEELLKTGDIDLNQIVICK